MKASKYTRTYALASQGIFSMIIFAVIGYCIGYFAIGKVLWGVLLAVLGLLIGLVSFIFNLLLIMKKEEEEQKKNENSDE